MKIKATLIGMTLFFAVFAIFYSPTLGKNRNIFDSIFNTKNNNQNQKIDNSVLSNIIADSQVNSKNNQDQNNSENSSDLSEDNAIVAGEKDVANANNQNLVLVTKVIDGDTIEIEGGQRVRYIGIDTPETVHPSKPVQCFGKEASNTNKDLVEGKYVRLEKDISETDKYNRLLRYIYLDDDTFVNLYLVEEGYATVFSYPPDIKYQTKFLEAEQKARSENIGLWGNCGNYEPDDECDIKGNISASGEKIYHMPGQYYYDKTSINESKGEKWFCNEQEALDAGWRKSLK